MKEEIISVGIDIGTSTTQVVFTKIVLENIASGARVPQIKIISKDVFYRSSIYFTPLLSETEINSKEVKKIIEDEYEKVGLKPKDISTGAVIITGETARKSNAKEVLNALSGMAGDFVVATAGPDLESIIAGKGSGSMDYSNKNNTQIYNLDIGGGTTNISYFDRGEIVDTTCLDIGGRLIKFKDSSLEITYISKKFKQLIDKLGLPLKVGEKASKLEIRKLCNKVAEILLESIGFKVKTDLYKDLITYRDFNSDHQLKYVNFSGGVADYIYRDEMVTDEYKYNDIGIVLGQEIKKVFKENDVAIVKAGETIGATVVGAGSHTVEISGSTITYTENVFPIKNLPVIRVKKENEGNTTLFKEELRQKIEWFKDEDGVQEVAVGITGENNMKYVKILELADAIYDVFKDNKRVIVIAENDIGKALGQALSLKYKNKEVIICLDGIKVSEGDFIDLGNPLGMGSVLPVVVKTILLGY